MPPQVSQPSFSPQTLHKTIMIVCITHAYKHFGTTGRFIYRSPAPPRMSSIERKSPGMKASDMFSTEFKRSSSIVKRSFNTKKGTMTVVELKNPAGALIKYSVAKYTADANKPGEVLIAPK